MINVSSAETTKPPRQLRAPFSEDEAEVLRAGDEVLLSGVVYTARDAAHERLVVLSSPTRPLG